MLSLLKYEENVNVGIRDMNLCLNSVMNVIRIYSNVVVYSQIVFSYHPYLLRLLLLHLLLHLPLHRVLLPLLLHHNPRCLRHEVSPPPLRALERVLNVTTPDSQVSDEGPFVSQKGRKKPLKQQ
jgi:hypothetical protein